MGRIRGQDIDFYSSDMSVDIDATTHFEENLNDTTMTIMNTKVMRFIAESSLMI